MKAILTILFIIFYFAGLSQNRLDTVANGETAIFRIAENKDTLIVNNSGSDKVYENPYGVYGAGRVFYIPKTAPDDTVETVLATMTNANDAMLFERGSVRRSQVIVPRGDLYFGSYGEGAKPKITVSTLRTGWQQGITTIYESDFSSGVDGWSEERVTLTGNIDGIGGEDNVLRSVAGDGTNYYSSQYDHGDLTANDSITISFDIYIPSTNTNIDQFKATYGGAHIITDYETPTADTWVSYTSKVNTVSGDDIIKIYMATGGSVYIDGDLDTMYIKNVSITAGSSENLFFSPNQDGCGQLANIGGDNNWVSTDSNLDSNYDWWHENDASKDTLWVYLDNPTDTAWIEAGTEKNTIQAYGKDNLTFNNLHVYGSQWMGIETDTCDNLEFVNCTFEYNGYQGLHLIESDNILIAYDSIRYNGGDGLYLKDSCDYSIVRNNVFYDNGIGNVGDRQEIGIWHAKFVDIYDNKFTHIRGGNTIESVSNYNNYNEDIDIYRNEFNVQVNAGEGDRAIQLWFADYEVYNNIFNWNGDTTQAIIWTGEFGSTLNTTVDFYNNTVIGGKVTLTIYDNGAASINPTNEFNIKNNIFYGADSLLIDVDADVAATDNINIDYNLYYPDTGSLFKWGASTSNFASWQSASGQDANSDNADPLFTTEFTDLTLQSGSPAIGTGTDVGLGNSNPDIGRYD